MALAATAENPATGQQQQQPALRKIPARKRQRARRSDIGKPRKPAAASTPAPVGTIQPTPARASAMATRAAAAKAGAEHPLALGLFQALPAAGEKLSMEDAKVWLDTAAAALKLIYHFPGTLSVTAMPAAA